MAGGRSVVRGESVGLTLHQVAIPSRHLDRSVAFYRDTLGAGLIVAFPRHGLALFRCAPPLT